MFERRPAAPVASNDFASVRDKPLLLALFPEINIALLHLSEEIYMQMEI